MEGEQLSPQESIKVIEQMIAQAKHKITDNGTLYLLWGWVILFCSLGHFLLISLRWVSHPGWIWFTTCIAAIFHVLFLSKQEKELNHKTYTQEMIAYVWITFGVCMAVTSFMFGKEGKWPDMYPIIIMIYGIPTFLSGALMRFNPLKVGGIACWILAVVASIAPIKFVLLILALAVIIAWIIPGYMLQHQYKKQTL